MGLANKNYANQRWETIGGKKIYCRSNWEATYATYLEWLKMKKQILEWEHEPKTFWFEQIKRGVRSYLPDFKITNLDQTHYWVEVKGYMDKKSQTKIKRFQKYYPQEKLVIRDGRWFSQFKEQLNFITKMMEKKCTG
jgi:uncharacterized protein DUF1064